MSRKLLNFAPIRFAEDSKEYRLYQIPYVDEHQLAELREAHNGTNSFFRFGNTIYHSPMVADGGFRGGELGMFHVDRDVQQTKALIHHILFRKIFEKDILAQSFYPIRFLSRLDEHNQLRNHLTPEEANRVAYRLGYEIDTRTLLKGSQPHYGVLFNAYYKWDINLSCLELQKRGIDLQDALVVQKVMSHEAFQPRRVLVGHIESIKDGIAVVDHEGETREFPLQELFLENSVGNRRDLLSRLLQPFKMKQIEDFLFHNAYDRMGAEKLISNAHKIYGFFKKQGDDGCLGNENGFKFTIAPFIDQHHDLWTEYLIQPPTYYFNPDRSQTEMDRLKGLKTFGPWDKGGIFTPSTPLIWAFYRETSEGFASQFLKKLRDMLVIRFRLSDVRIKEFRVGGNQISDFKREISRAFSEMGADEVAIAVVENASEFKHRAKTEDPYLFCKAKLINQGIPSQEVRIETMKMDDKSLGFALTNITLGMYAKMGGIPWRMPWGEQIHHEVAFGIGSKVFKVGRFGGGNRIVGFTTAFSGDGEFMLGSRSNAVPYEDYFETLRNKLIADIAYIKENRGWKEGQTIRIVFHLFKPFKNQEIEVVSTILESLKESFQVRFSFLTFASHHPFVLVDLPREVQDRKVTGNYKGKGQAKRLTCLRLDDQQYLLQLTGSKEIKSASHGYAPPLLVRLDERSTFRDMEYLVSQAARFASNSWRSTDNSTLPVTIMYSSLIAEVFGKLEAGGHLDELSLFNSKLDKKLWFL